MTGLLLDTHVLLWWFKDERLIDPSAEDAVGDPDRRVFVSAASFWEIAIKVKLRKLEAPADLLPRARGAGFETLDVRPEDGVGAGALPLHHADPFDRMIVHQAISRGLTLVTRDDKLARYDVRVLRA